MIVTFDFDDTLTQTIAEWGEDGCLEDTHFAGPHPVFVQTLKACVSNGDEVHVVTSRSDKWLKDTLKHLEEFGVLKLLAGVHHTNGEWKADWCLKNGINTDKHFDDDAEEIKQFNTKMPETVTIKVPMHHSWRGVE